MADIIELVDSTMKFTNGPFGNRVVVYLGNTSVKYPNILCKTASEVPKKVLLKGGSKEMRAHFQFLPGDGLTMSSDETSRLVELISQHMRKEGFFNCTYEIRGLQPTSDQSSNRSFSGSSASAKMQGKQAVRLMGARAFTRGNDVNFGKASPQQQLLGHQIAHVVQQ